MPGELDLALRIQSDFRAAVRDLQGVDRAVGRAGSTSRRAGRDTRSLANSLDLAGSASSSLKTSLGSTAALVARIGSGYVALRAGIRAARQELDFGRELSKITGLVGIARQQVNAWRADILKISRDTGKPLGELARGLFFITSAGQRGSQAIDTLANSAKASAAGLGETATIADAATSAVNAYTSAVLDSGTATGILVAAVREGKLEASQLAPVVGRVLPIAKQLGVQFHEVAAALAFFSRSGTSAREGATNLRTTLGLILNPGEEARRVLEEIGLDLEELRRTIRERGLLAGLRLLDRAVGGNAETIAKVIPSIEALTGVLSLVKGDAREVDAIFASLARAGLPDLQEAFAAAADTGSFKLEQSMRRLDTAANRLAEKTLPSLIDQFSELLDLAARYPKTTSVLGAAGTGAIIGAKVGGLPGAAAGAVIGTGVGIAATGDRPAPVVALRAKIEELRRNIKSTREEPGRSSQSREQQIAYLKKLIAENEKLIKAEIRKNAVADQDIFPDFATAAQRARSESETAPVRTRRRAGEERPTDAFSAYKRRIQELSRLRSEVSGEARGLLPPLEQSIAGIEEWNSRLTLAFLGAGATVSDYTRLHEVYQARIGQAYKESADEAEKSENRRRAFLDEVRGDLDAAAPDLSTPLERSLAQIDDWYARTAERLDDAGGDLGDYSRLGDVYLKRVDAAYLEHREIVVDTFGDIEVGIDTLSDSIEGAMNRAARRHCGVRRPGQAGFREPHRVYSGRRDSPASVGILSRIGPGPDHRELSGGLVHPAGRHQGHGHPGLCA